MLDKMKSGDIVIVSSNIDKLCLIGVSHVFDPYSKYSAIFVDRSTGNTHCMSTDSTGPVVMDEVIKWAEQMKGDGWKYAGPTDT